jgi:hypothetical protein
MATPVYTLEPSPTMPKDFSRPSLPTSSIDFALPPASSVASSSTLTLDDPVFCTPRFRRPTLKAGFASESRLHSPLATSFTIKQKPSDDENKGRLPSSSASHFETASTLEDWEDDTISAKRSRIQRPLHTPQRKSSSSSGEESKISKQRRLSFPVRLRLPRSCRVHPILC